jgi:hypothetical protein
MGWSLWCKRHRIQCTAALQCGKLRYQLRAKVVQALCTRGRVHSDPQASVPPMVNCAEHSSASAWKRRAMCLQDH